MRLSMPAISETVPQSPRPAGQPLLSSGSYYCFTSCPGSLPTRASTTTGGPFWDCTILLGWTGLGWAVAFIWACTNPAPRPPAARPPPSPARFIAAAGISVVATAAQAERVNVGDYFSLNMPGAWRVKKSGRHVHNEGAYIVYAVYNDSRDS